MTDIVERLERKSDDPIRTEAAAEIRRLRRTIAFFASVIKAGEPWTRLVSGNMTEPATWSQSHD